MKLKNIINFLAIFSIFSGSIRYTGPEFFLFQIYNFVLCLLFALLIILEGKVHFNKIFFFCISIIAFFSSFNILLNYTTPLLASQQIIGISIHSLVFFLLIKFNKENLKGLFLVYLNLAFFVALLGLIQAIVFFLYPNPLYLLRSFTENCAFVRWGFTQVLPSVVRINSISPEPASFCIAMMPAFFIALYSIGKNSKMFLSKAKSLAIIAAFLLSFSALGYIGVICSILLLVFNYFKPRIVLVTLVFTVFLTIFFYNKIPEFGLKVSETCDVLIGKKELEETNQSTYTLLRNALVTLDVIRQNYIFGHGLGSHEISFNEHTRKSKIIDPLSIFVLNKKDSNSLLLRILSETGLLGLSLFLVFIFKFYIKARGDKSNCISIINNSILILFIIRLIRQGNYFSEGFFFFFWLYYFTKKYESEKDFPR